jgi:endonuclease YncB( thermonuclease family)
VKKRLIVGAIGILSFLSWQAQSVREKTWYTVALVEDGDTFETTDRSMIRFDTLDAPEISNCGGEQAKKELERLILGKKINMYVVARDVFGRQVASVFIGKDWIDKKLLETGWVSYSSSTLDKQGVLKSVDAKNKTEKRGIYSELCTQYENKKQPKCVIKGNIIEEWLHRGEKAYHFPGCIQYNTTRIELWRGEQWFCSEKEAQAAGYKKSGGCGVKSWQ